MRKTTRALRVCLVLGVFLIPLSRAPQVLVGNTVPDGDECIVGLMAKHMLEGKRFPVFFYGQNYGLAFFEAGTAALFFWVFGMSGASLKAAMLVLWGLGWLFLVLAVRRLAKNTTAACIAAFALILCPAWGAFSMKARGGMVTAFVFTYLSLWIVAQLYDDSRPRRAACVAIGVSAGLVCLAQPIWILGLVPFLLFLVLRRRKISDGVLIAVGALSTVLLILGATASQRSAYWSPALFENLDVLQALERLPQRVWVTLSGAYWMTSRLDSGPVTNFCASSWFGALVVSCLLAVVRWRRGLRFLVSHVCILSVTGVFAFSLLTSNNMFMYRYMLPFTGFTVILVAVEFGALLKGKRIARTAAIVMMGSLFVSGAWSLVESRHLGFSGFPTPGGFAEEKAIDTLVDDLLSNGIGHVYCLDPMFQWNLMFASQERIVARWIDPADRCPEYPLAVDRALVSRKRVAIVGEASLARSLRATLVNLGYSRLQPRLIENRYFVLADPTIDLVRRLGFRLND